MEEIVEASKPCSEEVCSKRRAYRSQPRYKNIVHLWEFLLELLAKESCSSLITWVRKERGEFQLKNPEEVARRWGLVKGKVGMNYAKLSRALRYYYQQEIIKKVSSLMCIVELNQSPRNSILKTICCSALCQDCRQWCFSFECLDHWNGIS